MVVEPVGADTAASGDVANEMLSRGFLPLYTLHLLAQRPRHGNDLLREIAQRTDGTWQPSSSGVYAVLRKLERNGWITGHWESGVTRTKRTYSLTAAGGVELDARRATVVADAARVQRAIDLVAADLGTELAGNGDPR
jgi:DNA-binding PadR family transcriptional regulator